MTTCIIHTGYTMPNGYGQVTRLGKVWLAHRWAAYEAHGPCPEGQVVRHKCDVRACVNPEHLEYGTQADNLNDRKARHTYRKLNQKQADEIKSAKGMSRRCDVARKYQVSETMVSHIWNGRQW